LLRRIPPITELLKSEAAEAWLKTQPTALVTECLRAAAAETRRRLMDGGPDAPAPEGATLDAVLGRASELLRRALQPRLREAVNATGIILHTGLGRAVFPAIVVDSIQAELKGCATLALDPESGDRVERDELIEPILAELTGAEAATVVNNNAAATLLALAALAAERQVIVSRGQLIEIGGSFRLPEVMAQSRARLVEVGATNRTHLRDYANAISPDTAALLRVHPSNDRIVGFTSEPTLAELASLAHRSGIILIDDLGAGALLDLEPFGLPHEPTVRESIAAGADIVLFSGDKLIGASQAGIMVGRRDLIQRLRKHPLMRALRVDKTCLLVLERTLHLFRDPARLRREHPTYRMICAPLEVLRARARALTLLLAAAAPRIAASIEDATAFLGSGSLPTEAILSVAVTASLPGLGASELARRLRLDPACVFARIEAGRVWLDMRTVTDDQVAAIAAALARIAGKIDSPG
jgi:L-seryl-tRNA(Ser) seleniumtransferase